MNDFSLPPLGSVADQSMAASQAERASQAGASEDPDRAAVEFEKLLATMLVKELRSSLKGGFFPDGPGNDTYNAWFDEAIGDALGNSRSLGIVGQLKANMGAQAATGGAANSGQTQSPPGAGKDGLKS